MQCDSCPYKKRLRHSFTAGPPCEDTRRRCHLQAKDGGHWRNQPCWHHYLGLEGSSFCYLNLTVWYCITSPQFSSVQTLNRVRLFVTPWITVCQASLSITNSRSLLKPMSIESVMPSSHLILYRPLLLLPPVPTSIRVFSNESTLLIRWPKYWSFSFNISPSNEHPGLISIRMDWLDLLAKGLSRVFSNTTVQKHHFFCAQLSSVQLLHPYMTTGKP